MISRMKQIFYDSSSNYIEKEMKKSKLPILRRAQSSVQPIQKQIKAKNVAPIHASLEYNPVTRSYWLKDHSLTAHTTVNGSTVYGQIELNNGDLVCFGDSQPLVFENSTLVPLKQTKQITADYHDMFPEKQASIDKVHFPVLPRRQTPQSGGRGEALSSGREDHIKEIREIREIRDPPMRHDCLNQGGSRRSRDTRIMTGRHRREKRAGSADKALHGNSSSRGSSRSPRNETPSDSNDTPQVNVYSTGPELRLTGNPTRIRSVGNHLLQRVIRLQSELARKDQEIRELRAGATPMGIEQLSGYRSLLEQSEREKERLKDLLLKSASNIPQPLNSPNPRYRPKLHSTISIDPDQFEDTIYASQPDQIQNLARTKMAEVEVYRAFIRTLAYELQSFNDRVLRQPVRDYSDVFQAIVRALEEPFSYKLMEIEADCEAYLSELGAGKEVTEKLQHIVRDEKHHKISLLCNQLEVLLPVIRDAAAISKESIRVCSVFTQWSRQIGDEIRSRGLSAEILLESIDALKEQFAVNRMGRHWLPPSLTPLLRVAALEMRRQNEEISRETERLGSAHPEIEKEHSVKRRGKTAGDSARQSNTDSESSLPPVKEEEVISVEKLPLNGVRPSDQELSSPELDREEEIEILKKHIETAQFEKNEATVALESAQNSLEAERELTGSLQKEITELNRLVGDRETEIAGLNETVEDLMNQLDSVKREKTEIERDVELLHERFEQVAHPLNRIKRTLSGLSNDDHGNNGYEAEIEEERPNDHEREEREERDEDEVNSMRLDPLGSSPCLINETIIEEDEDGLASNRSREINMLQTQAQEVEIPDAIQEVENEHVIPSEDYKAEHSIQEEIHSPKEVNEIEMNEEKINGSARELAVPLVDEVLEKVQDEEEDDPSRKISQESNLGSDLGIKSRPISADAVSMDSRATINSEGETHDLAAAPHLLKKEEEKEKREEMKNLHEQNSTSSEKTGTTAIYMGNSQSFESGNEEKKEKGEEDKEEEDKEEEDKEEEDKEEEDGEETISPIQETSIVKRSSSQETTTRSRLSSMGGYDPYDLSNTERREKRKASPDPQITKEEVEPDEIVRILSSRSTPPPEDNLENGDLNGNQDENGDEVFSPDHHQKEKVPPGIEPLALKTPSHSDDEDEENENETLKNPDAKAELQLLSDQVKELYNIKDNLEERLGAWNPELCYKGCDLTTSDINSQMEAGEDEFKKVASYVFELLESDYELEREIQNEMTIEERRELRARVIERIVDHLHDLIRHHSHPGSQLSPTASQLGMYARGKKYNMIQDGPPPLMSDDDSFMEGRTPKDGRSLASREGQRSPLDPQESMNQPAASLAQGVLTAHMQSHLNTAMGRPSRDLIKMGSPQFKWTQDSFYHKIQMNSSNQRRSKSNPPPIHPKIPYIQPRMRF